jgi:hypothetical protein
VELITTLVEVEDQLTTEVPWAIHLHSEQVLQVDMAEVATALEELTVVLQELALTEQQTREAEEELLLLQVLLMV